MWCWTRLEVGRWLLPAETVCYSGCRLPLPLLLPLPLPLLHRSAGKQAARTGHRQAAAVAGLMRVALRPAGRTTRDCLRVLKARGHLVHVWTNAERWAPGKGGRKATVTVEGSTEAGGTDRGQSARLRSAQQYRTQRHGR